MNKSLLELLSRDHKHSEYWFDKSKDLRIGCNYDISKKFGNDSILIYRKGYNEVLIFRCDNKFKITPLFSSFSDEEDDELISRLNENKLKFKDLLRTFRNSLELIKSIQNG